MNVNGKRVEFNNENVPNYGLGEVLIGVKFAFDICQWEMC